MRFDGKTQRRRLKKLLLKEISVVDTAAHKPARIAIMKRADDTAVEKKMAMTSMVAGHSHNIIMVQAHDGGLAELRAGSTSYTEGHDHDWVMDDAGNIIIGDSEGHSHGISVLVSKVDDGAIEDLLAEGGVLAAAGSVSISPASTETAKNGPDDTTMTDAEKAEFEKKAADELALETARADNLGEIVKLSADQRVHYDALSIEDQGEFLKSEDKDAIVKNAAEADPVVYTSNDGDTFLKSDDSRLVKAAQRADKAEQAVAKAEATAKRAGFEKRAGDELGHLIGDDVVKADLLEAIESIPTEKRAAVLTILKSKDAGMAKAMETLGTSDEGDGEGANAEAKIQTLAKAHAIANPSLTPEQAYVAVLGTPEGRELHAQL